MQRAVEAFIRHVHTWASSRDDVRAVALVGSHARGDARTDSDIDLILLCTEPSDHLRDVGWVSQFGDVTSAILEDWGKVQSVRVHYRTVGPGGARQAHGLEAEFGIAEPDWAAEPLDQGTARVLRDVEFSRQPARAQHPETNRTLKPAAGYCWLQFSNTKKPGVKSQTASGIANPRASMQVTLAHTLPAAIPISGRVENEQLIDR